MCAGVGDINLDGGGFASVRTLLVDDGEDLGIGASAVALRTLVLEVTGDGQQYKVGLRRSDGFREPTGQAAFNTTAGHRITVGLPLTPSAWHASIMGRKIAYSEDPDFGRMRGIGITLSLVDAQGNRMDEGDLFHAGPFALTVHSMRVEDNK